jgi:hypothetical protein
MTGVPLGRFNSVMSAQPYSPLAQVYNPVVVDDNMMEDLSNSDNSAQPIISYGPATRRRFTSTQRRPVAVEPPDQAYSTQLRRFPTVPTMNKNKVSPPEHGILRSRSQDRYLKPQPLQPKASDISDREQHPQRSEFMQRLDDIERRQERIESLLAQISQNLSSNRT